MRFAKRSTSLKFKSKLLVFMNLYKYVFIYIKFQNAPGVVESLKIVTRENSERLARYGFDLATRLGRKKVTIVHKANIMKISDGLFLETCSEVAKEYPNIEHNNMIIDNCCMQMVSKPQQFDVMVRSLYFSLFLPSYLLVVCFRS